MLDIKGCLALSAECIKGAMPEYKKIKQGERDNQIQKCKDNIYFAKHSHLINLYCACSNIGWDEKTLRNKIIEENEKRILELSNIKKLYF